MLLYEKKTIINIHKGETIMMIMAIIMFVKFIVGDCNKPVLTKTVYDMNDPEDRKALEEYDNWYYNRKSFLRV